MSYIKQIKSKWSIGLDAEGFQSHFKVPALTSYLEKLVEKYTFHLKYILTGRTRKDELEQDRLLVEGPQTGEEGLSANYI